MTSLGDSTPSAEGIGRAAVRPIADITGASPGAHLVQFYEDDALLVATVARYLGDGLAAGDALAVIAIPQHERAFRDRLASAGHDLRAACATGQIVFLDANETLSTFMRDGEPDRRLFESVVGRLVAERAIRAGDARVRAYGEMVDLLWQRGARKAAVCLEELWNDLQIRHSFRLLRAYAMGSFYKEPAAVHSGAVEATALPPQYARALAREIEQREQVEEALRASLRELRAKEEELGRSEAQLRDFVENAAVGLHRVGADGTILWANRAELALLGYEAREYVGHPIAAFHVDQAVIADVLARLSRGESLHDHEVRLRAKDGSTKYVLISSNACFHEGEFIHTRCFMRDITAHRAAEAALRDSEQQLHRENVAARSRAEQLYHFAKSVVSAEKVEEVFEAALDAIEGALGTERGAILICDDADLMRFRAARGLSEQYRRAVEGHSPWPPNALAPQPVLVSDVESDAALQAFVPLFRQEKIGALAFFPLVTRGRLIGKFMVYYGDPHDYSSHELELAAAIANHLASVTARFAAIARLEETIRYNDLFAGVLAHDLRNPLGAIMSAAQLVLIRQEGAGAGISKPVSRILSSGQRMTRMIDQLLDLTRARVGGGIQLEPSEVNLADLCRQAVSELELACPTWTIEQQASGGLAGSWDPDRLLQIISNLVSNAGEHGRADSPIIVILDGRSADAVTLRVHNEGAIPEALLPTLFDPFRGTRHRGDSARGLGLGLFIVKQLAQAHGGTVEVTSSPLDGTTFSVVLPRRASRAVGR